MADHVKQIVALVERYGQRCVEHGAHTSVARDTLAYIELLVQSGRPAERPTELERALATKTQAPASDLAAPPEALVVMSNMLDSWVEGARANHEGLGHRGENIGEECWRSFAVEDIRKMIADAAAELREQGS